MKTEAAQQVSLRSGRAWAIGWWLLLLFAVANGVLALRYLLPSAPFAPPLPNVHLHRVALAIHASAAAVALIVGPFQFVNGLRARRLTLHRNVGWIYCGAVLVGGVAAFPLSLRAAFGWISTAGFMTLAVLWLGATGIALRLAVAGQIAAHGRWMLRSYALTAAAITLRLYLPLSQVLRLPFDDSYRAIAWLCWAGNLLAVELYLRSRRNGRVFASFSSRSPSLDEMS